MAGIDKTYGTPTQWLQCHAFLKDNNVQMKKELDYPIGLYGTKKNVAKLPETAEVVIWNTSEIQDIWLVKNCQLDFVQRRLREQYSSDDFFQFAEYVDFSINYVVIERIKSADSKKVDFGFYYFPNEEPDDTCLVLEPSDMVIVYGSTFWAEIINAARDLVAGYEARNPLCRNLEVVICYFGARLIVASDDVRIETSDGAKHKLQFVPTVFKEDLQCPKILHSYNSKDCKKVPSSGLVYVSGEDFIHSFDTYKQVETDWDFVVEGLQHGRFFIPNYIQPFIK